MPGQAISASVPYICSFRNIVSLIPYGVKTSAVKSVLESQTRNEQLPGTALLNHPSWYLYFDHASTSLLDLSKVNRWLEPQD